MDMFDLLFAIGWLLFRPIVQALYLHSESVTMDGGAAARSAHEAPRAGRSADAVPEERGV